MRRSSATDGQGGRKDRVVPFRPEHPTNAREPSRGSKRPVYMDEEHCRAIFEHANDVIVFVDSAGTITAANPRIERVLGYAPADIVGKRFTDLPIIPPECLRDLPRLFEAAVERKDIVASSGENRDAIEVALQHRGGTVLNGQLRVSLLDPLDTSKGYIAVLTDITERKQAEEALRDSEDKFKHVFDYSVIGKSITLPSGEMQANKAFCQMLGYSPEEFANRTWQKVTHPDDAEATQRVIDSLLSGEQNAARLTKRYLHKNGSVVWADVNTSLRRDKQGKPLYFMTTAIDITERKRAEEALQNNEERFRQIFENMSSGVVVYEAAKDGEDFIINNLNRASTRIEGVEREQVIGKSVLEVFPGVKSFGLFEVFQRVWRSGRPEHHPTGRYEDQRISGWRENYICRLPSGEVVAIYEDITEHKQMEEALRESEAKFRSIFEHMAAACCIDEIVYEDGKPVDYRIIDVNPSYETTVGISRNAAVGALASKLYGTGDAPFLDIYAKVAETGHAASFEAYFAPTGKYLQITSSCPGKGRFSNVFADITEAKKAEQQLLEYQDRLRRLATELTLAEERERRRIAVGVHDQIGQRLALIKLTLQSLCASCSDNPIVSTLGGVCKDIDQAVEDAHSLTFELSNPVLYEAGFAEAVESWLARQVRERHGIEYTFEADESGTDMDKEASVALFHIVRELLTNVIKHAKATHVDVRIQRTGDAMQIVVQDDGVGFEPSGTGKSVSQSGGFGLFNVREKLQYMGGSLKIDSALGEGTCVEAVAPLRRSRGPKEGENCHEDSDRR